MMIKSLLQYKHNWNCYIIYTVVTYTVCSSTYYKNYEANMPEPEEKKKTLEGNGSNPQTKKEGGNKKKDHDGGNAKGFAPHAPKFEGKCTDLRGCIYDASDARHSDQFIKTTGEISEHVGCTYKYGGDICLAVENLSLPTIVQPANPPEDAGHTTIMI